jgi:hypothetical protein
MRACPADPGSHPSQGRERGNTMLPGLSSADCQVAWILHQQLVKDGLHEQFMATLSPAPGNARPQRRSIRHQLGAFLSRSWRSLQDMRTNPSKSFGQVMAK